MVLGGQMNRQQGHPILLSGLDAGSQVTPLKPVPYLVAKEVMGASYDENWLQSLVAAHPEILPYAELGESTFATARSICTELPIAGKYLDNLLATEQGGIVLVECKLWRNPEARRSVIGQILDYATELSKWDYEQLDAAVRRAKPPEGVSKESNLYSRLKSHDGLDERDFVDEVSRNLRRGQFLLLVIGDGIREGIEAMAEFLQSHAGLRFTLGLAEIALYRLPDDRYLAHPRVLARTERIERGVVILTDERIAVQPPPDATKAAVPAGTGIRIPATISDEVLLKQLESKQVGLGAELQNFLKRVEALEVFKEPTPTMIKLIGRANDDLWPIATIDPKSATVWLESMATKARAAGREGAGVRLYQRLVDLLEDEALRREKLAPGTRTGTRGLPLSPLLQKSKQWESAIQEYLKAVAA
jgi:hypothetical protein